MLLTIKEVANELSISRSSVYRLIAQGRISTVTILGKKRVTRKSLERFITDLERESRMGALL
jgi:excisionase family DNA binding protein